MAVNTEYVLFIDFKAGIFVKSYQIGVFLAVCTVQNVNYLKKAYKNFTQSRKCAILNSSLFLIIGINYGKDSVDMAKQESEFLMYKGKPLVRSGDTIYYGDMSDEYVIKLNIKSKKTVNDTEIADKVSIQLLSTDPNLSPRKAVIKSSEKNGMYLAMDIAEAWLSRALAKAEQN